MKALILLGGLGTRLRPFTLERPKPLLPIANQPMFFYQLSLLKAFGVRDVVLALGYKAAYFRKHLGDGRRWGVRLTYSLEKEPLGTGGAIRLALPHLAGSPSFIFNGDALADFDLRALAAQHRRTGAKATLTLTPVPDPSAFGVIEVDAQNRILSFLEKPSPDQTTANTINAGCYLFEPGVIAGIPAGRPVSIEREIFPQLLAEKTPFFGFRHDGYWSDVGTLPTYHAAHAHVLGAFARWEKTFKLGARRLKAGVWGAPGTRVPASLKVRGTLLLAPGARVGEGVMVEGFSCLGARAVVGARTFLKDCVLHDGARVGEDSKVERSLLGAGARLGSFSQVTGAVLGAGSSWGDYARTDAVPAPRP